jgi:hypothetical protein
LTETISKDFDLTYTGWREVRRVLIHHLLNRIAIHDHLQNNPDVLQQRIPRPLIVTGQPRTGSTMLQRLLAQDANCHSLTFWKACRPVLPAQTETPDSDPRVAEAESYLRWFHKLAPQCNSIHPMHPTYPEECTLLLRNTFVSMAFLVYGPVERYGEWYWSVDRHPAYRDYRCQLQLLQRHDPGKRWILKAPAHVNSLASLRAVFPDACIVQTHRDPLKTIPSVCSLIATMRGVVSDRVDPCQIGQSCLRDHDVRLTVGDRERERMDPAQFFDVHFNELMQDPIEAVRRIYEYFHFPYTAAFERRMRTWLTENRREKHGRHRYQLEQFGLTPHQVQESFADYCRRYGVEPDRAPSSNVKAA